MNILGKIWNGFCWLWVGLFLLGVPGGVLMYFTEPDATFFESIGVAIFCIPLAWMFYAIGPKKSKDKRIEEMKAIAERAAKKKAAEEREALQKEAAEEWKAMEKKKAEEERKKAEEKEAKERKIEDDLIQEIKVMISNNQHYKLVEGKMIPFNFKHVEESEIKKIKSYISKGRDKTIKALCDEDQFKSYQKRKICLGMHIDVVKEIKGEIYDEKRDISRGKEVLKHYYGKFTSSRGNTRYKLEVTYQDNRVIRFRDL